MEQQGIIEKNDIGTNYSFMLLAGEWKNWFSDEHYRMILANALNDCVYYEEREQAKVAITGYYFTGRRAYIVLKVQHTNINWNLSSFFEKFKSILLRTLNSWLNLPEYVVKRAQLEKIRVEDLKLFEKLPVNNHWLLQLITGRKVVLKGYDRQSGTYVEYFDFRLERLKKLLNQETYCSINDYAGGEGPVIVTKLEHNEHI